MLDRKNLSPATRQRRSPAQETTIREASQRALLRACVTELSGSAHAVSRVVNGVKNDTEECIKPIDDETTRTAAHESILFLSAMFTRFSVAAQSHRLTL